MKLTQQTVETAIYEGRSHMSKSGRKRWSQHVLWDDSLPGFGLRITPTNRKSFIVSYRAAGRKRTKNLGAAGKLKLAEARRRAKEFLASVEEQPRETAGPSPIEGVTTVAQLADAYLEQHLKGSVPSWYADQRLMQTHIKPAMGRSPVAEVTQTDLANIRSRVAKRFPADSRRLATLLAGMFDWAAEHGLWSKSSGGLRTARAAPGKAPSGTAPPDAAELQKSLERSEAERQALTERLDEVSASGAQMVSKLGEKAAEIEELERELDIARRELDRATRAGTGQPLHQETEKQLANLRQSVDQLMASLRETSDERDAMAKKLARVEVRDARQAQKAAELMQRRNELETELLDKERRIAILRSQRRAGAGRIVLWLAAGALGGALLSFVASRAFGPGPAAARPEARPAPAAATAGGAARETEGSAPAVDQPPHEPAAGARAQPAAPPPSEPGGSSSTQPAATAADPSPGPTGSQPPAGAPTAEIAPDFTAVEAAVRSWAAAWSEQRVDDYLAAYSERFTPPDGLERSEWAAQRRDRILRPATIRVALGELRQTALGADRVGVEFRQDYEADSYADRVRKTLELVWEDGGWKIAAERAP